MQQRMEWQTTKQPISTMDSSTRIKRVL